MRPIDADKLKQHYAWWEGSDNRSVQEQKELLDQIVDAQPTVDNWISTDDRLPEPFEPVLVYIPSKFPFPTVAEGYFTGEYYFVLHRLMGAFSLDSITHWMPLPEPPKEGE